MHRKCGRVEARRTPGESVPDQSGLAGGTIVRFAVAITAFAGVVLATRYAPLASSDGLQVLKRDR